LQINSNRFLKEINWSTGETNHEITISESGAYSVSVSDGHCPLRTLDADISFVADDFGSVPFLDLPGDTTVCSEELPLEFFPASDFSDSIYFESNLLSGDILQFGEEGEFPFSILYEGCEFSDTFSLRVGGCEAKVYLPSAFSPNGDGANDFFFPQGVNFVPRSLSVYDRWGGRLYFSEGPEFEWDGGEAQTGVYVYLFEYLDEYSGQVKKSTGDVNLLR
jgi:gliding motility-associated-like protein